jgi:hypothetical protein
VFFKRIITAAAAVVAAAVPAQPALARPDAMLKPPIAQDLRSPDARPAPAAIQDLRSPDARDAADTRATFSAPEVAVVKATEPSPASGGLDWADVGIGAGGMLALTLLASGATLAIIRRRQSAGGRQAATAG